MSTKDPGVRRRKGVASVVVATVLAMALGAGAPAAEGRCATVGLDSVSHTQCGLP